MLIVDSLKISQVRTKQIDNNTMRVGISVNNEKKLSSMSLNKKKKRAYVCNNNNNDCEWNGEFNQEAIYQCLCTYIIIFFIDSGLDNFKLLLHNVYKKKMCV